MVYKSVLITGCSKGGLGSALAFEFQRAGLKVFATVRNAAKLDPELGRLPNVEIVQLEATSTESIAAAVKEVDAKLDGRLDILVNNAGGGMITSFLDADLDEARRLFETNFFAMWAVTQAFMPLLLKSKGLIVNQASIAGFVSQPYNCFYSSSKAAITSVSETMRLELAPLGVKVIALETGAVKSEFFANINPPGLSERSLYKGASKEFSMIAAGGQVKGVMTSQVYAQKVVRDIMGGATGKVWRGTYSTTIQFASSFLPTWLLDRILLADSGLEKVKRENV